MGQLLDNRGGDKNLSKSFNGFLLLLNVIKIKKKKKKHTTFVSLNALAKDQLKQRLFGNLAFLQMRGYLSFRNL